MVLTVVACGGFLLAVLWMDLLFDVQVLRHRDPELPEAVLASIAGYYRRVTIDARPMSHLIATVMGVGLIALLLQVVEGPRGRGLASVILVGGAVALAALRVYPNAVRLGTRADSSAVQSALARAICRDHFVCLGAVIGFLALQLTSALP